MLYKQKEGDQQQLEIVKGLYEFTIGVIFRLEDCLEKEKFDQELALQYLLKLEDLKTEARRLDQVRNTLSGLKDLIK